jgi:Flp pilus assembly protein TadG
MRRKRRRGATLIEFVLAGIPAIFLIISVEEIGRGMWNYHTLARAVNAAAHLAAVRGQGCTTSTNSCSVSVGTITTAIQSAGPGLLPNKLKVQLTTNSGDVTTCNPISNCTSSSTTWPPSTNSDNVPGKGLTVSAQYSFQTPLAMFWPGAGKADLASSFTFPAASTQLILF